MEQLQNKPFTLITGASEGLGKAFALECAKRHQNLVLVALPGPELIALELFIKRNFKVQVYAIAQDLTSQNGPDMIAAKLDALGLPVNVLINNAGVGNTRLFKDENRNALINQIRINVMATTIMTHLLVPLLKASGPSHILNVSSLACFFAIPKKQVYGGTKSYIYFFSRSLRAELGADNINVSVLCPGGINSNPLQTMLNKSGTWISRKSLMNPEDIAPLALDALFRKRAVIIPGKLNKTFLYLDRLVPAWIKQTIIKKQIGSLKEFKSAGIVKQIKNPPTSHSVSTIAGIRHR